jgi:hypothetical protein
MRIKGYNFGSPQEFTTFKTKVDFIVGFDGCGAVRRTEADLDTTVRQNAEPKGSETNPRSRDAFNGGFSDQSARHPSLGAAYSHVFLM